MILDSIKHNQFWIPEGYAHGFLVLSDFADVNYKTTNFYSKKHEASIVWNDPNFSISWPMDGDEVKLSPKDNEAPLSKNLLQEELL